MKKMIGNFLYTGAEGLEPPNNGAKNRRLTTWLCPKLHSIMTGGDEKVNSTPHKIRYEKGANH